MNFSSFSYVQIEKPKNWKIWGKAEKEGKVRLEQNYGSYSNENNDYYLF